MESAVAGCSLCFDLIEIQVVCPRFANKDDCSKEISGSFGFGIIRNIFKIEDTSISFDILIIAMQ